LIGLDDGSSFIVILPPSVSFVNDEELELFCARTVLLTVLIVDAADNMTTIVITNVTITQVIFIIIT
jgi:hypothetical protein